jgi:transposase InsO family protein
MFEDLYSRKIIGSTISEHEDEAIASELLEQCIESEKITGKSLRLHSDNGSAMKGFRFLEKVRSLGVIPSRSRPRVSNDNPFIEALFKTMKYRPEYPYKPFKNIHEAKTWVNKFIDWYNHEHLHSRIGYVTPVQRHEGLDLRVFEKRNEVFKEAKAKTPERWNILTKKWKSIAMVELNKVGCRAV